jgi:pimeloyl-ACP methyl ester carboxylesterase
MHTVFRSQKVNEIHAFYREAGPVDALAVLLLHGFPTASHMFRDLCALPAGGRRGLSARPAGRGNPPAGYGAFRVESAR